MKSLIFDKFEVDCQEKYPNTCLNYQHNTFWNIWSLLRTLSWDVHFTLSFPFHVAVEVYHSQACVLWANSACPNIKKGTTKIVSDNHWLLLILCSGVVPVWINFQKSCWELLENNIGWLMHTLKIPYSQSTEWSTLIVSSHGHALEKPFWIWCSPSFCGIWCNIHFQNYSW